MVFISIKFITLRANCEQSMLHVQHICFCLDFRVILIVAFVYFEAWRGIVEWLASRVVSVSDLNAEGPVQILVKDRENLVMEIVNIYHI